MPWLSEEFPDWEELCDDERESLRAVLCDLGMTFPADEEPDYCE